MFFQKTPQTFKNVPDSEKLDHVYAYVVQKEKEDAAVLLWKWLWRGVIVISIYFLYLQGLAIMRGGNGGVDLGSLQKALGGIAGLPNIPNQP